MNTEKLNAVIAKVQESVDVDDQEIKDFINADWPEGDEHTAWLESASVDEIADWVIAGM